MDEKNERETWNGMIELKRERSKKKKKNERTKGRKNDKIREIKLKTY